MLKGFWELIGKTIRGIIIRGVTMESDNKAEIETVKQLVHEVYPGITDQEGECLYQLAKSRQGEGVIVEIGSWQGRSTIWLAKGSEAGRKAKVYAIDPHKGTSMHSFVGEPKTMTIFKKNIQQAGVEHIVNPIVMKSAKAIKGWKQPISLLWIDGSHDYEDVLRDFLLYEPYLESGGVIAFHDCLSPGPRPVIRQHVFKSNSFSKIGAIHQIVYATKCESVSFRDKVVKLRFLLLSYAADLVDFLTKSKWLSLSRPFFGKLGMAITRRKTLTGT